MAGTGLTRSTGNYCKNYGLGFSSAIIGAAPINGLFLKEKFDDEVWLTLNQNSLAIRRFGALM